MLYITLVELNLTYGFKTHRLTNLSIGCKYKNQNIGTSKRREFLTDMDFEGRSETLEKAILIRYSIRNRIDSHQAMDIVEGEGLMG